MATRSRPKLWSGYLLGLAGRNCAAPDTPSDRRTTKPHRPTSAGHQWAHIAFIIGRSFLFWCVFSGEKTGGFRKIYPSYLIANIVIIVKTANIVIIVIIAIIVKTANIVITGITAISYLSYPIAICRKLALSSPGRTGQLPPASYQTLCGD